MPPMLKIGIDFPDPGRFGGSFSGGPGGNRVKDFYGRSMQIVVDDIIRGIASRVGVDGAPFPRLELSTIMRKLHDHQLVDKGLLSDPFTYEQINGWRQGQGEITIKPLTAPVEAARKTKSGKWTTRARRGAARDTPRNEVGYYLQIEGLDNGKHFYFFGISQDAQAKIMQIIEVLVLEAMAEAAK